MYFQKKILLFAPLLEFQFEIFCELSFRLTHIKTDEWLEAVRSRWGRGIHPQPYFQTSTPSCVIHMRRGIDIDSNSWRWSTWREFSSRVQVLSRYEPKCEWHLFSMGEKEDFKEFSKALPNLIFHLEHDNGDKNPKTATDIESFFRSVTYTIPF